MDYTPLKQLFTVAEHGRGKGDCWRTSIACLLKLNHPEEVPTFDGDNWWPDTLRWLEERGYGVEMWSVGDVDHPKFPDGPHLLLGTSPRFYPDNNSPIRHCCIGIKGEVVHDPHPENTGLIRTETCIFIRKGL